MSKETTVQYKGGIGICGWLFLIFTTLKLTGYIAWSWWWVTAPLWAPVAIVAGVLGIGFLVYCLVDK